MAISSRVKGALAALTLAAGGLVFGLPWGLYRLGLDALPDRPQPPLALASKAEQQALWLRAGCEGEPEGAVLDPVTYLLSASVQARPAPIVAFAWRIASDHSQARLRHQGAFQRHLAGAALTIWLTRHWSVDQLLTRVAEIERRPAG
jgi:hypothetical protein